MIPKIIHMIWPAGKPEPWWLGKTQDAWLRLNPGWTMVTHGHDEELDPEYRPYWDGLKGHASRRSELLRASILDHHGGVYVDVDTYPLKPIPDCLTETRPAELAVAHHYPDEPDSWFMAAHPGSWVFHEIKRAVLSVPLSQRLASRIILGRFFRWIKRMYPDAIPYQPVGLFSVQNYDVDRGVMLDLWGEGATDTDTRDAFALHYFAGNADILRSEVSDAE